MSAVSGNLASEVAQDLAAKLKAAGFYDADEYVESAFANILLMGPPKRGKTTAIVTTAPSLVAVINCDGDSALKYPRRLGCSNYMPISVPMRGTLRGLAKARTAAQKAVAAGCRYLLVDSLSNLADNILDELSETMSTDSRKMFGELLKELMRTVKFFMSLDAHTFFVSHMCHGYETEGIIPMIAGSAANKIPGLVDDVVLFDYQAEREPARMFAVGPQKDWNYLGRSVRRSALIPATVPALFEELGITL